MANIYQRGRSPYWYGEYRLAGKRERFATGCTDRRAAQLKADEAEAAAKAALKNAGGTRFGEAASVFFASKKFKPSTVKQYERSMGYILQTLGDFPMASIGRGEVQDYIAERIKQCGSVTLRRELAFLQSLYSFTMTWDKKLEVNPVKMVEKKHIPDAKKRKRYATRVEYLKLLEECNSELHKTFLICAVHTGMRHQELVRLHMDEIDLEGGLISLPEHRTKTDEPREIPLAVDALEALRELRINWLHYYVSKPWTHAGSHKRRPARSDWSGFFFENNMTGKPITSVQKWWEGLCERAGIKDLRIHDLRHTFATWGLQSGADQISLMSITGHRSVQSFARYSHATKEGRQRAINLLSGHTVVTRPNDNSVTGGCS